MVIFKTLVTVRDINSTTHFRGTGFLFGHALANFAFVAVLTSSFALLAFSKY